MNKFNIGNQVIIKDTGEVGWITGDVGSGYFMVAIQDTENYVVSVKIFISDVIELKQCENGSYGYCDFISDSPSAGQFACAMCELKRVEAVYEDK